MHKYDLAIHSRYCLLSAHPKFLVLENQFIGIQNGKIISINSDPILKTDTKDWLDASNHIVIPGLINSHTHLTMSLMRGLSEDVPFHDWLFKTILPLETKILDPEFVEIGTMLSIAESIRFGTTTVCDMYYFSDKVAEMIDRTGVRGFAGEAILDFPSPDNPSKNDSDYRILEDNISRYKNHSRVKISVATHAPYTCNDDTLKKAMNFSEKHNLKLQIHLAETETEILDSLKQFGKTPTKRLFDLGFLNLKPVCAHGVHLNDEDIDLIVKSGASIIYNPESNMKLGSGTAPIPKLISRGVTVGIGTDGPASNNDLSIFREMDTGTKFQKAFHKNNTAMTAKQALHLATLGGAKSFALDQEIGSIEAGKKADLTCISLNEPHMHPINDIASTLVYGTSGLEVDHVVCDGKILLKNKKHTTIDLNSLYERVEELRNKIHKALK